MPGGPRSGDRSRMTGHLGRQRDELPVFRPRQAGKYFGLKRLDNRAERGQKRFAFGREKETARPSIRFVDVARDQPLAFQPINDRADGRPVLCDLVGQAGLVDARMPADGIKRGELDRREVESGLLHAAQENLRGDLVQPADQMSGHRRYGRHRRTIPQNDKCAHYFGRHEHGKIVCVLIIYRAGESDAVPS